MATTVITGKSATFTFDAVAGTAQITTFTPDESRSSSTVETLSGSAVTGSTRERKITAEFLFDGNEVGGGFYAACKDSFEADATGTLTADIDGAAWTGVGLVDSLSTPAPADGPVTGSVTFKMSTWTYTAPVV
jgi:hypothetical protein